MPTPVGGQARRRQQAVLVVVVVVVVNITACSWQLHRPSFDTLTTPTTTTMLTLTALLLALSVAAPASCASHERLGRMSFPQETSPVKARFRAAKKDALAAPLPTPAPAYSELGYMPILKPRADVGTDTCGYHTDDGIEITCGSTATCTNSGSIRDCCLRGGCTTSEFRTTCYDSTATECATRAPEGAHCCTYDEAPFCATYLWATTESPGVSFTLIACESTAFAGQLSLAAEFPSGTDSTTTTKKTTRTTSRTSSTDTDSSTTDSSTRTTGTGTGSPTGTGTSPPSPTSSASSTPVGAIAGGVVGGVAVLGLVAIAVIFFLRRGKTNNSNASTMPPPSTAAGTIGGGPGPSPYGSPPPMAQTPPAFAGYGTPPPDQQHQQPYGQHGPQQQAYAAYAHPGQSPSPPHNPFASPNSNTGLFPGGGPGSPDPSKHYSAVSSDMGGYYAPQQQHQPQPGQWGAPPPQHQHQQYQAYQPQVAEMGTTNPAGSQGNRAELG